jgi:hypothetical protein
VCTFVDVLTKQVHFAPTFKDVTAEGVARLYVENVFRLHGLSEAITMDRDSKFTSEFYSSLFQLLGVSLKMSTANHPETDGQSERMHRLLVEILRAFVRAHQRDWVRWLPMCEFAINNAVNSSTGYSPFYLNSGFNPRSPVDLLLPKQMRGASDHVLEWVRQSQRAITVAQDALEGAKLRQMQSADQSRRAVSYEVGDKVLVHKDAISTAESRAGPAHKLRPLFFGPYTVTKVTATTVTVKFPNTVRAHPVLHVDAVKPYVENEFRGRAAPPPHPLTDAEGHTRYIVSAVEGERRMRAKLQYLVRWEGYAHPTWEPAEFLLDEEGHDIEPLADYKKMLSTTQRRGRVC